VIGVVEGTWRGWRDVDGIREAIGMGTALDGGVPDPMNAMVGDGLHGRKGSAAT
jgi:hypothetical protein